MEGQILLWIQENLRFDWLNPIMRLITSLGNDSIFWIALTLVLVFFAKTRRAALGSALAMILTLIVVNIALKPIFARTRPYILLENLQILSSKLQIDSGCYFGTDDYTIGLLCGMGSANVDYSQIACVAVGANPETVKITVNDNQVTLGFTAA